MRTKSYIERTNRRSVTPVESELQTDFVDGELNVQNFEYWSEGNALRFRLFQNGAPTADVTCR